MTPEERAKVDKYLGIAPMAPPTAYAQQMANGEGYVPPPAGVHPNAPGFVPPPLPAGAAPIVIPPVEMVSPSAPPTKLGPRVSFGPSGGVVPAPLPTNADKPWLVNERELAGAMSKLKAGPGTSPASLPTNADKPWLVNERELAGAMQKLKAGAPAKPAAPRPPSWTDQRRGDEQDYLKSFQTERDATKEVADAHAVVQDEASQGQARLARMQEEQAANEAAFQRDESEARAQYRAQTQQQVEQAREMKVDPGRLYRDSGAWTGVLTAVGGALAGALAGLQGRAGNDFVDIINKNIDRDINAQQTAINQKTASIADRNTLYGQLVSSHKDDTLARAQTRVSMLEAARTHMESEATRLGTPEAAARFKVADSQLARTQAQAEAQVHGAEEQAAARAAAAQAAARAAAAAAAERRADKRFEQGVKLEELGIKRAEVDAKSDGMAKLDERFVATGQDPKTGQATGYMARNAKVAEERTKGLIGAKQAMSTIDSILDRRNKEGTIGRASSRPEGGPLGTPEWKTANRADHSALLSQVKEAWKLGALSGSDMDLVLNFIGKDPNALDLVGDETSDRLRAAKKRLQEGIDAEAQQEAGNRVVKGQRADGREAYVPLGGSNAPTNRRVVPRFGPDGQPLK